MSTHKFLKLCRDSAYRQNIYGERERQRRAVAGLFAAFSIWTGGILP